MTLHHMLINYWPLLGEGGNAASGPTRPWSGEHKNALSPGIQAQYARQKGLGPATESSLLPVPGRSPARLSARPQPGPRPNPDPNPSPTPIRDHNQPALQTDLD